MIASSKSSNEYLHQWGYGKYATWVLGLGFVWILQVVLAFSSKTLDKCVLPMGWANGSKAC